MLSGWERLLHFIRDSISNGSKEVAFAAINCLQTTVTSHCPKGNLSVPYLKSILAVYELVLQRSPSYTNSGAYKVKQEILHGLGELFVQAKMLFDNEMYSQLLVILHMAIRHSIAISNSFEAEFGIVQSMHRTILEIIPLLHPTEHLSSMWPQFLRELLRYLPGFGSPFYEKNGKVECTDNLCQDPKSVKATHLGLVIQDDGSDGSNIALNETERHVISDLSVGAELISPKNVEGDFVNSNSGISSGAVACTSKYLFGEKLISVLIELFLEAPVAEKGNVCPEIIHCLGRCMVTRRDNPNGMLWRLAVEGFNRILIDDVARLNMDQGNEQVVNRSTRTRLWKEVADVYDIFLVGSCGHAISSDAFSAEMLNADESLDMAILNVLGDVILKAQLDAPSDSLQRLVSALDRCASRTGSLPIETVSLLPSHCSRFSLSCLQKLFSLTSPFWLVISFGVMLMTLYLHLLLPLLPRAPLSLT
uniref:Protein MON2 n=1 Tax=Anthurium amnicola TaxID=1678845 RepID=A0A1D1Z879_9ARAE